MDIENLYFIEVPPKKEDRLYGSQNEISENKIKKVYLTKENTILIVDIDIDGFYSNGYPYVTVTANEIIPIRFEYAEKLFEDYLEDGELWKMAVESDNTTESLDQFIERLIDDEDELLAYLDTSLYPEENTINGERVIYQSGGCGCMHDTIKEVDPNLQWFIDHHLKHDVMTLMIARQKLKKMFSDDIDKKVKEFTCQILED